MTTAQLRRTTGEATYAEVDGFVHAEHANVIDGQSVTHDQRLTADVVVIGSGAGGGPAAKELAEGGLKVIVLEEGAHRTADELNARPRDMVPILYRDAGQTVTVGRPPIPIPLGRTLGGTTFVNMGTCFRTPAYVLERWRNEHGLDTDLDPFFRRVERELHVSQVPARIAGPNANIVRRGAEALGWSGDFIFRNARGCVGSGVCAYGCPANAKQHTGITYLPKAWNAGAISYTRTRLTRVQIEHGEARGVEARTLGGARLTISAQTIILAAGTLHTPLLLQASGIKHPELGRNLSIHPASAVFARMEEEVGMWDGVPQSYYVDQFAAQGIMFEGVAGPPDYLAISLPGYGIAHRDLLLDAKRLAQFGVMVSDTSRGHVHKGPGNQPLIRYDLNRSDTQTFHEGLIHLAELYFAAGAKEVLLPIGPLKKLTDGNLEPLRRLKLKAGHLKVMAFHPLGTARADADPALGVLDEQQQVRGARGLFVADGSAVPSALGVNPQITIMTLSTRLAFRLLGKQPPTDEPHPEKIA